MDTYETEIREAEGHTIIGMALPFFDVALAAPGRPEIAARGAIASPTTVELRDGHSGPRIGTATVYETADGYEMRGELDAPDSDRYRGGRLSVGMNVIADKVRNGVRVLEQIILDHVAVVTNPAYQAAAITETRSNDMAETTEAEATATAVVSPVTDTDMADMAELREQIADVQRMLAAQAKREEETVEYALPPEIRSAGDYVYHRTVALNPGQVTPTQHALSLERLRTTETELRQQTTETGQSPLPTPLLGPIVDIVRSGSPLTQAIGSRGLPSEGGMTIRRPHVTQGTAGAWETTEGDAAGSQQYTTDETVAAIKTWKIANNLTVQAVLRSNPSAVDGLLRDQAAVIAAAMEDAVISGDGDISLTTGTLAGILNTVGIQDEDLGTWTASAFMAAWSNAYAKVLAATNNPPRFVGVHPRRWAKLLGLLDGQDRPLFSISTVGTPVNVPGGGGFGAGSDAGGVNSIGSIQGIPVVASSAIPVNLGTGTNEDVMILYGGGSAEPFEIYADGVMRQQWTNPSTFQTTYSAAFMASMMPIRAAGVCTITGAGLV